jgi:hypothetical protein
MSLFRSQDASERSGGKRAHLNGRLRIGIPPRQRILHQPWSEKTCRYRLFSASRDIALLRMGLAIRDRLPPSHDGKVAELQGSFMSLVQATVPVLNMRRSQWSRRRASQRLKNFTIFDRPRSLALAPQLP